MDECDCSVKLHKVGQWDCHCHYPVVGCDGGVSLFEDRGDRRSSPAVGDGACCESSSEPRRQCSGQQMGRLGIACPSGHSGRPAHGHSIAIPLPRQLAAARRAPVVQLSRRSQNFSSGSSLYIQLCCRIRVKREQARGRIKLAVRRGTV